MTRARVWGRRTNLELLGCVVARVDRVLVRARVAVQLPSVDLDGGQFQGAVGGFGEFAVLPLNYAGWAFGICCYRVLAAALLPVHAPQ